MMMSNEIQLITNLVIKSRDFNKLSINRNVYCPFNALGIARYELRHSNFLANLLNPYATHGFGSSCLKSFADTILEAAGEHQVRLALHIETITDVEVLREWNNIDLLAILSIEGQSKKIIIAVEVKIEAGESGGQLNRYESVVAHYFPGAIHVFAYLTPSGEEPSSEKWIPVSFAAVIDGFESEILKTDMGEPTARTMLKAYSAMMRRRYVEDPELEELARRVWAKHEDALNFLIEKRPNNTSRILKSIFDRIPSEVNKRLGAAELLPKLIGLKVGSRYATFAVETWDQIPGMLTGFSDDWKNRLCVFEVEANQDRLSVRFVVCPGPEEQRMKIINSIDRIQSTTLRSRRRREKITSDYTRMCSLTIINQQGMRDLTGNGLRDDDFEKLISKLADYLVLHIREFTIAFSNISEGEI